MEERYELARERIRDIAENEKESKYCQKIARFFMLVFAVYERRKKGITISFEEKKEENTAMYRDVFPENYDTDFIQSYVRQRAVWRGGGFFMLFCKPFPGSH